MHIGVCIFATDYAIRIDELARAAEDRGFESLFVPEHTHIPTSRRSPFAGGGELPEEYSHTLRSVRVADGRGRRDHASSRSAPASASSSSATPSPPPRRSRASTLLSNGRFLFGIGGGWNAEEMENHGTDLQDPLPAAARAGAGHEGDLDEGRGRVPRRARQLRPDLGVAQAGAEAAPARAAGRRERPHARSAWSTSATAGSRAARNAERVASGLADLKARAAKAGRDMKTITTSVFGAAPDARTLDKWAAGRRQPRHPAPAFRGPRQDPAAARPVGEARLALRALSGTGG